MNTDMIIILVVAVVALYVAWSHGKLTGINKTLTGASAPAVTAAAKTGLSAVGADIASAFRAAEAAVKAAAPAPAAAPTVLVPQAGTMATPVTVTAEQLAALGIKVA